MNITRVVIEGATDNLFDGDTSGVDVLASEREYARILDQRVRETFPGCRVLIESGNGVITGYYASGPGATHTDVAVARTLVQRLAEELYDDGNLWIVPEAAQ